MVASDPITSKAAAIGGCCGKGMLPPGLADLFEALGVIRSAAHAIKVLRDEWVIVTGQGDPIDVDRALVTGIGSQGKAYTAVDCARIGLLKANQVANDNVRAGNGSHSRLVKGRQPSRLNVAMFIQMQHFDRLHRRADGDAADDCSGIRRPAKRAGKLWRHKQPATADAQELSLGIIIVMVSFNLKEGKAAAAIAHGKIALFARGQLLNDKMVQRVPGQERHICRALGASLSSRGAARATDRYTPGWERRNWPPRQTARRPVWPQENPASF